MAKKLAAGAVLATIYTISATAIGAVVRGPRYGSRGLLWDFLVGSGIIAAPAASKWAIKQFEGETNG